MTEPKKSDDIPATKRMIDELSDELKSDNASLSLKISSMDSRISSLDSKIDSVKDELKSDIMKLTAAVHRSNALVEEQNNKNNFVLDGYAQIYDQIKDLQKNKADKLDTI